MTATEYRMIHYWIRKHAGPPKYCNKCPNERNIRLQWSNNSGEYKKDVSDWEPLCQSCHLKKDRTTNTHCSKGHKYTEDNTYQYPGSNRRACRICRKKSHAATNAITNPTHNPLRKGSK